MLGVTSITLPTSPFPPLALGFMGLGTSYMIYGPQELFGFPKRSATVDLGMGVWGIWLSGFMQFVTGAYLFAGLTLFHTFTTKALYMAALAFTAYGIHWFGIGWNRMSGADPRVNFGMTIGFLLISALGAVAFFGVSDNPVGGLFVGLSLVYVADMVHASGVFRRSSLPERALGFFHLGTGAWLLYLMWATVLNFTNGYHLPL